MDAAAATVTGEATRSSSSGHKRPLDASDEEEASPSGGSRKHAKVTAAAASEGGAAAANRVEATLSMAQLLYTDGLHSIFEFLSLKDLQPALRSCRWWRDAAYKEKRRDVKYVAGPASLPSLLSSHLRHHVSVYFNSDSHCTFADLALLARLPSLTDLVVSFDEETLVEKLQRAICTVEDAAADSSATRFVKLSKSDRSSLLAQWPQRLRRLNLWVDYSEGDLPRSVKSCQALLDLVAKLPSTLTDLSLEIPYRSDEYDEPPPVVPLDLTSLLKRRKEGRITRLTLENGRVGKETIEQIKQMKSLQYLEINDGNWSVEQMQWLCTRPHRLRRLEEINLSTSESLTRAHLRALARLPALTRLEPASFDLSALPRLTPGRFPHLRSLRLMINNCRSSAMTVAVLQPFGTQLTALSLMCDFESEDQMQHMCSLLPSLQSLTFYWSSLPSLLGLRALHQLRELTLECCKQLKADHLLDLQHVASLRTLTVAFPPVAGRDRSSVHAWIVRAREVCASPLLRHFDKLPRGADSALFPHDYDTEDDDDQNAPGRNIDDFNSEADG